MKTILYAGIGIAIGLLIGGFIGMFLGKVVFEDEDFIIDRNEDGLITAMKYL